MGKTFNEIWMNSRAKSPRGSTVPSFLILPGTPEYNRAEVAYKRREIRLQVEETPGAKPASMKVTISHHKPTKKASGVKAHRMLKYASLYTIKTCIYELSAIVAADASLVGHIETHPLVYKTLNERFGGVGPDFGAYVMGRVYTNLHKVHKDTTLVISVLGELFDEMHTFTESTCIKAFISNHHKMRKDEEALLAECKVKQSKYEKLQKELQSDKSNNAVRFGKLNADIACKLQELKDLRSYSLEAVKYIERWEVSRREQNSMSLQWKEGSYASKIKKFQKNTSGENTCHGGITAFYEESRRDYQNEIESWMERYDKEMETKDNDICGIKLEIEKAEESAEKFRKTFNERSKQMAAWLEYKAVKKEKAKQLEYQNKCATKIQAWWRGVMVRRKLGPYRVKKKNDKKKEKKNRKEKSKK